MPSPRVIERVRETAAAIAELQRPIRILRSLAWPESVAAAFFASGARELPRPTYSRRDFSDTIHEFRSLIARSDGDNEPERLLRETCESWIAGAELLAVVGTREFHARSVACYGQPSSVSCDGKSTNLALAAHFDGALAAHSGADLGAPPAACVPADVVARTLGARFAAIFPDERIHCEVADTLSANAVTSAERVRIRRGAQLSDRDVEQLLVHEGYVHLGTTLNGRRQPLPFLASGAPRTTRTQEGLAIFAEFISQTIDLDRLRRLTDRILAIKMAEDGADFLELYRFFLGRGHEEGAAFDCTRRVMRGGLVEGGAPFTKDVVYLDGLLRVANFLRASIMRGRADFVRLMFAGKLALEDVPVLAQLAEAQLLVEPRYLPPWASDLRFVVAYMSFSAFLNQSNLGATREYYERLIARVERSAW